MNSTLPNFPASPAAAPAAGSAILPGFDPLATTPATSGPLIDFAALMSGGAPASGANVTAVATATVSTETVTVGAPNILSLCLPAGEVESAMTEVSDTMRDEAAAFACAFLQALLPELLVTVPVEGKGAASPLPAAPGPAAPAGAPTTPAPTALSAFLAPETIKAQTGVEKAAFPAMATLPTPAAVGPELPLNPAAVTAPATGSAPAVEVPAASRSTLAEVAPLAPGLEQFEFRCAADGAIEVKLKQDELPAESLTYGQTGELLAVEATLELPGEAVVRLDASVTLPSAERGVAGQENFAAGRKGEKKEGKIGSLLRERKIETADYSLVKDNSKQDGIAVAKPDAVMAPAPTQEAPHSRHTAPVSPVAADFQPTKGAEATVETAAVVAENKLAERAVATVTNLVEAQFGASMQKSGSVQFRLKLGGEDLSIRVELRGGEVLTDFQTDSAELRAAISREWQAVAAQSPEQMRRYVEPVFSAGSSNSFSSSQDGQQSAGRQQQSALQQEFSQQRSARQHQEEAAPFARQSLLRDTFFAEPASPRVPTLLPTSVRLSALA